MMPGGGWGVDMGRAREGVGAEDEKIHRILTWRNGFPMAHTCSPAQVARVGTYHGKLKTRGNLWR